MASATRNELKTSPPAEAAFNAISNFSGSHDLVSANSNKNKSIIILFLIFFQIFIVYLLYSSQEIAHWNSFARMYSLTGTSSHLYNNMLNASAHTDCPNATCKQEIMKKLPDCPEEPPDLKGPINVSFESPPNSFEDISSNNPHGDDGGHYKPQNCTARAKVAIIIPFRDRDEHLRYFLQYMLPTLQRQQLDFRIYVMNQFGAGVFNRAKLMTVGYAEAVKDYDFQCFVFHDVDLVLENDRSLYTCPPSPRHLSVAVDKFNYKLPYSNLFGGVTAFTRDQFEKVNGYSNRFWGWGGEDDEMFSRVRAKGMNIVRYPAEISRYKMIKHDREKGNKPNPQRVAMIGEVARYQQSDGISSLSYMVIARDLFPTYTKVTVDLFGPR